MRNTGEYGNKNEIAMREFKDFLSKLNMLQDDTIIVGIALDNPNVTPTDELRYDVGCYIDETRNIDLETKKLDDGNYAIFEVPHTKEAVMAFWQSIPIVMADVAIDYERVIIERYARDKLRKHLREFCISIQ